MSQENVEIALLVAPEGDLAEWVRDDAVWAGWVERVAPYFDRGFMGSIQTGLGMGGRGDTFVGFDAARAAILDWTAAMASYYRRETEKTIDLGDRVLVVAHEYVRIPGSDAEIQISPAQVFEFAHGKIVRWDSWLDRADALKAVGLEE